MSRSCSCTTHVLSSTTNHTTNQPRTPPNNPTPPTKQHKTMASRFSSVAFRGVMAASSRTAPRFVAPAVTVAARRASTFAASATASRTAFGARALGAAAVLGASAMVATTGTVYAAKVDYKAVRSRVAWVTHYFAPRGPPSPAQGCRHASPFVLGITHSPHHLCHTHHTRCCCHHFRFVMPLLS